MAKDWLIAPPSSDVESASRRWGVSALLAQLLINRGHSPAMSAASFLAPSLKDLHSPDRLHGVTAAVGVLAEAIRSRTKIVLYGDYDVDGTTGTAILWHVLRRAGADVSFYVPHRIEEGYGLNREAVHGLVRQGAGLIVTVDCGITAVEAAADLRAAGVPLIVTDHHAIPGPLPEAAALVHPALDAAYPNRDLCAAGVAFKLAWALAQDRSGAERVAPEYRELLLDMLPLAALGTIADLVPLTAENRVIAKHGLSLLPRTRLPGLRALMKSAGLLGEKVNGQDVGFKLAPRINAAGRMGHAQLAVELFTRANESRADEIAALLEEHNRIRQATERNIARQAHEMIETNGYADDAHRGIVLASRGWHAGVIGIVAARIVERHHRPTVLIALGEGEGQGSARSIRHFDLADALSHCRERLLSFGGHAMAAGLRIAPSRINDFREAFVGWANQRLTGADLTPKLRIDAEVHLKDLSLSVVESMAQLGPFGIGNPKPRLATDWIELAGEPRCVGRSDDHLQVAFRHEGVQLKGIGFGLAPAVEDLKQFRRCRAAFEPIINEFQGRRTVEMQLVDLQFPQASG
jgi:single-stranded-DNA-specific exonuclease